MSFEVQTSPFIQHFRVPSADVFIVTPFNATLNEGAQSASFNVPAGTFSATTFITALENKLNLISPNRYTYSVNNSGETRLMSKGGIRGLQVGITSTGQFAIN